MKRIAFLFVLFSIYCVAIAQNKFKEPLWVEPPPPVESNTSSFSMMPPPTSIYIDYDYTENNAWFGFPSGGYSNYIWPMNMRYNGADSMWRYGMVAFDSLYNYNTSTGYNSSSVSSVIVDSILLRFGHSNLSGTTDTIIAKLLAVDNNGYPTNTILWSDTVFTNFGLSLLNNYLYTATRKFYPSFAVNGNKFAVKIEYYGSELDTFGITAGYGYTLGLCGTNPSYKFAQASKFSKITTVPSLAPMYANSFSFWTNPNLNNQYPAADGNNIIFACSSRNYMQNLTIGAYVTLDQTVVANATGTTTICEGRTTTINGNKLGGTAPFTYQWAPATGLSCDTCAITAASPPATTVYTLTVTDGTSTVSTDTMTVTMSANDVVASFTDSITNLQVKFTNTSQNANAYLWNFGIGASPATAFGVGPYTIHYSTGGTKTVKLRATKSADLCADSIAVDILVTGVGIQETSNLSATTIFPNPFHDHSTLEFYLPTSGDVELIITDIAGRIIHGEMHSNMGAGQQKINIHGKSFSPGSYFYQIKTNRSTITRPFSVY